MPNSNKLLLSIAGLTATGKTDLALKLAAEAIKTEKYQGATLISADSKQVYQGLEILTGADIPPKFKRVSNQPHDYFQHESLPIQIHGSSIINPVEEWSVAHFCDLAVKIINSAWQNNWLPIVVGGTGFYHQQLLKLNPTTYIKPDEKLRKKVQIMSTEELQVWLQQINQGKYFSMNNSDRNNSRRLIRAIEIELYYQKNKNQKNEIGLIQSDKYTSVGLFTNQEILENLIKKRVEQRVKAGAVQEIESLLKLDLDRNSPAMTATGVKPLKDYLQDKINLDEAKKLWSLQELQYAKRQLTWFKKYKPDYWLTVDLRKSSANLLQELENNGFNY